MHGIPSEEIAKRIKNECKSLHLSQSDLAKKARIQTNLISKMERGYYPSLPMLEKIAASLEIPVAKLIIIKRFSS